MDSFVIRPAILEDAQAIAAVKYHGWQHTYRGIIHDAFLDAIKQEELEKEWQKILKPGVSRAATDVLVIGEEIAGYITYGKNPNAQFEAEAEVLAFYLLKKYHHKGLGRRLFEYAVEQLKLAGAKSIYLQVITKNPAIDFYRKFKPTAEYPVINHIGGIDYNEIVMVWRYE
jgi:ribosomal protein S18 acetylase RimI-like enzyme